MKMHNQYMGGRCHICGGMHDWHDHMGHHNWGGNMKMQKMMGFMKAAHSAKKSLLKEKIKAKLEAKMGKKLDKIADLAVEVMMKKWEAKKAKMMKKKEMMEQFKSIMMEEK